MLVQCSLSICQWQLDISTHLALGFPDTRVIICYAFFTVARSSGQKWLKGSFSSHTELKIPKVELNTYATCTQKQNCISVRHTLAVIKTSLPHSIASRIRLNSGSPKTNKPLIRAAEIVNLDNRPLAKIEPAYVNLWVAPPSSLPYGPNKHNK